MNNVYVCVDAGGTTSKAAIFDERLKQYGDKASQIFREALDQYLDTHPDVSKFKKKMEGDK